MVRMLDGVDPETLEIIGHAARHVPRVEEVTDLRARWIGDRLHAEVSITVPGGLSVGDGHEIAKEVRHQLLHHLPRLGRVMVHVGPYGQGGEKHHRVPEHTHDGLPRTLTTERFDRGFPSANTSIYRTYSTFSD